MPNTQWMLKSDVARLRLVLRAIEQVQDSESFAPLMHERLLDRLLQRSPKKTGMLFEEFTRVNNNFAKGADASHDATLGSERIEIKGSRVITQHPSTASNLLECLLDEERFFVPVKKALVQGYDCNVQQIKRRSFDRLVYTLYFADVIVECEMTSAQLDSFVEDKALGVCPHIYAGMLRDADGNTTGEALRCAVDKAQLGYCDFQHAGNEGEGQFHIKPSNVLYHLARHAKRFYTYEQFADVLRAQPL